LSSSRQRETQEKKDSSQIFPDSTISFPNILKLSNGNVALKETENEKNQSNNVFNDIAKYLKQEEEDDVEAMIAAEIESTDEDGEESSILVPALGTGLLSAGFLLSQNPEVAQFISNAVADPTTTLQSVVDNISAMGDLGYAYFALVYIVAEVLAIPAIPLTASAGYLFGVRDGTAVVLLSGSIAAAIGFLIGRTLLRERVEKILQEYPKFQAIDRVIGKEGFKLMVLLRLSPIFPFSLSNYLYGVTSLKFWPYFCGTMIGFAPGTLAYVYTGTVGKALISPDGDAQPWYVYAIVLAAFSGVLKVVADVASSFIESLDEESSE